MTEPSNHKTSKVKAGGLLAAGAVAGMLLGGLIGRNDGVPDTAALGALAGTLLGIGTTFSTLPRASRKGALPLAGVIFAALALPLLIKALG